MAKPIICKNPTCTITFGSTVVDISDHLVRVTPSTDPEIVDNRTFANPSGQDFGNTTNGMTLSLGWSPTLYAALAPFIDTQGSLVCKPIGTVNTAIRATVRYGAMPWGDIAPGERSEVELACIVDGDITYS